MLLNRTRSLLAALAGLLLGASAAVAQHDMQWVPPMEDPYEYHNGQPFAPFDQTGYGKGPKGPKPNEGFFGGIERMVWFVSKPERALIGSPDGQILLTGGGLDFTADNTLDTGWLTGTPGWGNRYELGYMVDQRGWLISAFGKVAQSHRNDIFPGNILFRDPELLLAGYRDTNPANGIDDDLDGDRVFGRDGIDYGTPVPGGFILPFDGIPDANTPPDLDDLVYFLPRFDRVVMDHLTEVSGVEVMRSWRLDQFHNGGVWEWYLGARFLQIDDRFQIQAAGGILDEFFLWHKVDNHIVGPQVAARWSKAQGRLVYSAEGRFTAGVNFRSIRQEGNIATEFDVTQVDNAPLNLTPTSFKTSYHDEQFAPVGELRLNASYYLTKEIALKAGWTGIFAGGVARAVNTIDYALPRPGIIDPNWGEDFFTTGFNFGIEINR